MDLTDEQWGAVEALLPKPVVREDGRGRPWRDPRDVLNGVLWILRTGAPWADMPDRYPPYATCFRRFQSWVEEGVLQHVLQALADDLVARGKLDLSETFIDGRICTNTGTFIHGYAGDYACGVHARGYPGDGGRAAARATSDGRAGGRHRHEPYSPSPH